MGQDNSRPPSPLFQPTATIELVYPPAVAYYNTDYARPVMIPVAVNPPAYQQAFPSAPTTPPIVAPIPRQPVAIIPELPVLDLPTETVTEWLYVLQLSENKFYVGKTTDLPRRLAEHYNGRGAAWTQRYPPLANNPLQAMPVVDGLSENNLTRQLMGQHGIEAVRGGRYCQINLTPEQLAELASEFASAVDACLHCRQAGHFIATCPASKLCQRCGRNTHTIESCYAKTHLRGQNLPPRR